MPAACTYRTCALAVSARWNGLAVVRGEARERVANLNFFTPRSIAGAFPNSGDPASDSALAWAARATQRRHIAAFGTDVGLGTLVVAGIIAAKNHGFNAAARNAAGVGTTMFILSAPIQFAADNALSRALWWFNLRFAR